MTTPFFRMIRYKDQITDDSYFSCEELEGAITFIHSAITMCGHVPAANKGMPFICEYNGGGIPLNKIIAARDDLRRKNQTDADTPCKGCQYLKKRNWGKNEYPINHITVGYYTPCNLMCTYCYRTEYTKEENKKFSTPPYDITTSISSILGQGLLAPNSTAWLTGGEPTLFDKFAQILDVLMKNNVKTTIGANCIKSFDVIKEGLRNNTVEVLCSVDAGTREKYNEIKGKDCFDAVWNNLGEYASVNADNVVVKYIFMDENASETEVLNFIRMCSMKNIRKIAISRDIRKYKGVLSSSEEAMPEEMFRSIVLMMFEAIKNGIEVYFDVNWEVFTDDEILKIKLLLLESAINSKHPIGDLDLKRYYCGITDLFDLIIDNANARKSDSPAKPYQNK